MEKAKKEKGLGLTYTKENILRAEKFKRHRDLLSIILDNTLEYNPEQVEKLIDEYNRKEVK